MSKIKIIFGAIAALVIITIILFAAKETSALEHEGNTTGDEIWIKEDNPHLVKDNFTISREDELFILDGCLLKFERKASLNVEGKIFVNGSKDYGINFTANSSEPFIGYWKGIIIKEKGTCIINYCNIEYSEIGIFANTLSSDFLIANNTAISNVSESSVLFIDTQIDTSLNNITSNTDIKLVFENSTATLTNFTANQHEINIILKHNSNIIARDIKFETISFEDDESILYSQFHIDIKIIDDRNDVIKNAVISVKYNNTFIYKGLTDELGYIKYIYCTEFIKNSEEKKYLTPYYIIAKKDELKKEIKVDIEDSNEIVIILEIWNNKPSVQLLYPTNSNTVFESSCTLWWYGKDLDEEDHDILTYMVYFGNKINSLDKITDGKSNEFYRLENLENGKYYWRVEVSDGKMINSSETWSFYVKIKTYEPEITLDYPVNETINYTSVILQWHASDKDNDNLTYDVYFDPVDASTLISENQTGTVFYLSGLDKETVYYWRVVVFDGTTKVSSDPKYPKYFIVNRETPPIIPPPSNETNNEIKNNTPPKITLLSPKNNAKVIKNSVILKFSANDADEDNLTYDIYMDTKDASTLLIESYKGIEYLIENLVDGAKYYWKVVVKDGKSNDTSLTWSFTVEYSENTFKAENDEEPEDNIKIDAVTIAIGSTMVVTSLFAYLAFTENGRYHFLKFLAIPLYSRLKKEKILMNDYRIKIFTHIKENPGVHLRSIMNNFGLKNGAAIHHLTTLERNEFIKSLRDGPYRRYYPKGFKILEEPLDIQNKIYNEIKKNPGIMQKEIASNINMSRQVAGYHIKKLIKDKKIAIVRDGKTNRYYLHSVEQ